MHAPGSNESAAVRRRVAAWVLYDFANSTYSAVIAAVVFPVFYTTVVVGNEGGLGDLWWGRAISLSMLLVAVSSPFMGGIADISERRKAFLAVYTFVAVVCVALFASLDRGMIVYGFILIVIANTCVEGGMVFYNSYLPVIVGRQDIGKTSARGYAAGYLGSILSLILALYLIRSDMIRMVWIEVSLLFGLFSIPIFLFMPRDGRREGFGRAAMLGLRQSVRTLRFLMTTRETVFFLLAYFFYTDGVNTIIVFTSVFAASTLQFSTDEIILLFLVVQFSALVGSFLISLPIVRLGPLRIVKASLIVWMSATVLTFYVQTKIQFLGIALIAGLVLGTIQASSRALFAYFIPREREAEFFGVYSTVGKTSSVMGPLMFGFLSEYFKSQRPAVLSVMILFVLGYVCISQLRNKY